ncbi:unnamed protein product [Rotaria sordida]|uniref:General stress protein FMN-binding split barrel domain-containing protein n=1 Tax=Rotaria sordida TaxID=392033 RepID=A0A819FN66_9BILA|nr:unnamed protein product [Rotaria sordida]CAF1071273.1 unnamed protein product [Rotaria sordida]CAF3723162.1 unnamed protein product [Rotaria sordida]CAF3868354.1 unnamed protein product [Rotaria sordida]
MNRFAQSLIKTTLFQFKNVNLIGRQSLAFISTTNDDKTKKLFDLIKDIRYAMITTIESDKSLRSRPMASRQAETWDGTLWFFTKRSSPKVKEVKQNLDQVNVSYGDPNKMSFVSVSGKAEFVDDKAKLKELWSSYLKVFFPQGLDDPDLILMKVTVNYGEYWDSPSSKMVQLYSMAKAAVTKNPQALGENEKIDIQNCLKDMNTDETSKSLTVTTNSSSEIKHMNIEDLKTSFIGKTSEYINTMLNTVLDDPVLLRVAIRRCRLDCAEAERRITKLKEDNKEYVPKNEYLALQQTYDELVKASEQLKQNFRNAKVEYNALKEALEYLIKDRDKYFTLCETYRATLTPRPKWERCASIIEGGIEHWNELSIGKTSNELVDILLNEIIGGNDIYNNVVNFIGLGLDPTIPKFLQTTSNIRNRHFMQRDISLLIEDIWKKKIEYDLEQESTTTSKQNIKISLVDFVHIYLKQRFPDDELLQLEWGYNLVVGCRRFKLSPDISNFWSVLLGQTDEEVYHQKRISFNNEKQNS